MSIGNKTCSTVICIISVIDNTILVLQLHLYIKEGAVVSVIVW